MEGLAKHLRCVGVDAAIPSSKKPDPRLVHLSNSADYVWYPELVFASIEYNELEGA